jgi:excisionase family DNA binding protein
VYRRFLAASDEIGAGALRMMGSGPADGDAASDDLGAAWARDAAPVILDRVGAALLAGDPRVLLDHLSVELSELRRTGVSEVHLITLLDALAAGMSDDLVPARRVLEQGRDHLLRSGARPVRAIAAADSAGETQAARGGNRTGSGGAHRAAPQPPGQAFADLLLLGALACQAPAALLSVPQSDGTWSTLPYGLDSKEGSHDGQLFQAIATSDEPVEIADLATRLPRSPLTQPPHSFRWAYGLALRQEHGTVMGVVVVLDRYVRPVTSREQRALASLARQLGAQLVQWVWPVDATPDRAAGAISLSRRGDHPAGAGRAGAGGRPVPPPVQGSRGRWSGASKEPAPGTSGGLPAGRPNLLRSHEVAEIFDVTERTVINWAAAGKLPSLRTVGGHLRFRREDVLRLLAPPSGSPG